MCLELDHIFICVSRHAPEAECIIRSGLTEGPPNIHPGQGTANRRFFFQNSMLELLWIENPIEAQSEQTKPTLLWERWSKRSSGACPFGFVLRPAVPGGHEVPFPAWEYLPDWLPPDQRIYVSPATVAEPMWVFMPFLRRGSHAQRFSPHSNGARVIAAVTLTSPVQLASGAALAVVRAGLMRLDQGAEHLLTLELDHRATNESTDFRPELPLLFRR